MFNIGPLELVVLAFVGIIVLGPDRLPGLAKDAARLIHALREMATGAHAQLREELGPEFADIDLRTLHPRALISRTLLGDDIDLKSLNSRAAIQKVLLGEASPGDSAAPMSSPATTENALPTSLDPLKPNVPFDTDTT